MSLPPSLRALWSDYISAESMRKRPEADTILETFLADLTKLPDEAWHGWAIGCAMKSLEEMGGTPIRPMLFREALFPALRDGLLSRQPHCARLLAGCMGLLHHCPECMAQLPEGLRWWDDLLRHALEIDPGDLRARDQMLSSVARQIDYSLHELPDGVLYDASSAEADQCLVLLEDLREFEALAEAAGRSEEYTNLIERARFYIPDYREYLLARSAGDTYAKWLESRAPAPVSYRRQ